MSKLEKGKKEKKKKQGSRAGVPKIDASLSVPGLNNRNETYLQTQYRYSKNNAIGKGPGAAVNNGKLHEWSVFPSPQWHTRSLVRIGI